LFFSGTNHLVVIGIGRGVDGVEDVAVKGASTAVYIGGQRRGARRCAGVHAEEEEGFVLLLAWTPIASPRPNRYVAWASYWAGSTGFGLVTLSLFFFSSSVSFLFVLFCVLNFQTDI
jgi:hypothetical protein